jgi:hypothetical protein
MTRKIGVLVLMGAAILSSCAKKETREAAKASESPQATAVGGPHAVVVLKDGSKVPGSVVASSQTDMVVAGDDGIERKIPLAQVKSVEYGETSQAAPVRQRQHEAPQPTQTARKSAPSQQRASSPPSTQQTPPPTQQMPTAPAQATAPPSAPAPPPPAVTTKSYELPEASEISVRTNETIDSATANEGQTFDAQVTRDANDADGAVVIPRGSRARIVIKSATKGGRFRGASDLVLDLQSVLIGGKSYTIDTVDITQRGKAGVGANKRTAEYTGGGAALGAIIGAIAGGGKGAAIGAGAGAGAGALTQVLTKGGAIRVPVETVLTFRLDKALRVTAIE